MPSARNVFWMGFTTYKIDGNKLFFKVQNPNPSQNPGEAPVPQKSSNTGPEQFLEATLTPGVEYIQHGDKTDTKFIFMSPDVTYWQNLGWKKIGEARHMESMEDFDTAHEVRKLLNEVIIRFGPVFVWV